METTRPQPANHPLHHYRLHLILFLFFLSGFSGLIYESIWTHYLKLILGHSAYAQTLVLVIFMGGLAIGAYLTTRFIHRIKNALVLYAVVEAIIGIAAFFFHDLFLLVDDFLFNSAAENIDSIFAFQLSKWSLAAILILPQSILLGTTFPLISTGVLHLSEKQNPGRIFSLLYFNNSLGAAIGILVSGFFLIQQFGLPGTIATAGWINIAVAVSVFLLLKPELSFKSIVIKQLSIKPVEKDQLHILMLAIAFFTGMASFFYEIAWIRMLTLLLGATTHSFELMISAFILGLALGSLWIKRRIDTFTNPVAVLGYVQLLMAIFALLTLTFYSNLYDFMAYLLQAIERNAQNYPYYLFANHLLALAVMLPATFFAGMTLPLITNTLYKRNKNDRVIGQVYAINTLGAIIGIVIATNVLLPTVGTKGLLGLGSLLDIAMGLLVLGMLYLKQSKPRFIIAALSTMVIFQVIYQFSEIPPLKTSTGVFRTGEANWDEGTEVLFHKDGKLSTVDIVRFPDGYTILSNNGKPDAGINLTSNSASADESTMVMLAALPLSINPDIKTVANIGMGSGQTVQTLLSFNTVKQVDTIEIEQAVIDALPYFKQFSNQVTSDNRSNVYIEDAKSFFSFSKKKYDLIVAEPPNPWVSGVASLFTNEFYSRVKRSLQQDGMFVQWLQLYEINIKTLSLIFSSLDKNFKHYSVYFSDDTNIMIIASDVGNLSHPKQEIFKTTSNPSMLRRVGLASVDDVKSRFFGNKQYISSLFEIDKKEYTSDFYPEIEYLAGKSLFINENLVGELYSALSYPLPVHKHLQNKITNTTLNVLPYRYYSRATATFIAKNILSHLANNKMSLSNIYTNETYSDFSAFQNQMHNCQPNKISDIEGLTLTHKIIRHTAPYLGKNDFSLLLNAIKNTPCYQKLPTLQKQFIRLYDANNQADYKNAYRLAMEIFNEQWELLPKEMKEYLVISALLANKKTKAELNTSGILSSYLKPGSGSHLPLVAMPLLHLD